MVPTRPRPIPQDRAQLDALEERWLAGDPGAIDEIHRHYRRRLEGVAFRILRSHSDAEDVVQRIFVALGRVGFDGRSSLWTYLYRAAVNGSVNVLRSRRRRDAAEQRLFDAQLMTAPLHAAGPEARILEGEIMAEVAQALLKVKPQHRRVLVLRIVHGLSNAEIARREGLPPATVGTWLRRGREELRRTLSPLLEELSS